LLKEKVSSEKLLCLIICKNWTTKTISSQAFIGISGSACRVYSFWHNFFLECNWTKTHVSLPTNYLEMYNNSEMEDKRSSN